MDFCSENSHYYQYSHRNILLDIWMKSLCNASEGRKWGVFVDYVKPKEVVSSIAEAGANKASLPVSHILIKAILSGAFLGYATTLAFTASTQTGLDIAGAVIFPVGFVLILLLNLELVTGSFAMLPIAKMRSKTTIPLMLRNFSWAFAGNLIGSILSASLIT